MHFGELPPGATELEISISYERLTVERAMLCIGFQDENEREVGAAVLPLMSLGGSHGSIRCSIRPLPFWRGIYFPVVAIVSAGGQVEDRWELDRAVVIDGDGEASLVSVFGPMKIHAQWSNGGVAD